MCKYMKSSHIPSLLTLTHIVAVLLMYLLLFLGGAKETQFEIRRAEVGENVTLTCVRRQSDNRLVLFWTRFVHGSLPEVLGAAFSFDSDITNNSSRIRCEQGPGTFLLHILKVTPHDTGFYYCIKTSLHSMIFLKGTFLTIQGKYDLK